MPTIVNKIVTTGQVFWHIARLDDKSLQVAMPSMAALRKFGAASLPALRRGIRKNDEPRIQLRSAVILHWLGDNQGLPVLVDSLRHGHFNRKGNADIIVDCFLAIGAPDATRALIDVWKQLTDLSDFNQTAVIICEMWKELADPSMLHVVSDSCTKAPNLFLDTVPAFGAMAIVDLKRLTLQEDPAKRIMAIRCLARVRGPQAFEVLVPLLIDSNSEVRNEVPAAIEEASGAIPTLTALVANLRNGYSSVSSIQTLIHYNPPELHSLLSGLITRYSPPLTAYCDDQSKDSLGAVCEAILAFKNCNWPNAQVTQLICAAVDRPDRAIHPSVITAASAVIAERGRTTDDSNNLAIRTLWNFLTLVDNEARTASATAISRLGDPLGATYMALLNDYRPNENLLSKLKSTMLTSQDVGVAMSEAVQHVAQWFNKVSRETAERFATPSSSNALTETLHSDTRIGPILSRLLRNALSHLKENRWDANSIEAISIGVAVLRLSGKLNLELSEEFETNLREAIYLTKQAQLPGGQGTRRLVIEEVAGVLREAAGQAMVEARYAGTFDLLAAGLSNSEDEVKVTCCSSLAKLGDPRAVPLLQTVADGESPMPSQAARAALSAIRKGNPEMMTLLRGSSGHEARADLLLRPSMGIDPDRSGELLLRPSTDET